MNYPHTIEELVEAIYQDNDEHLSFSDEDCDCAVHTTITTIRQYWGE